ncbi:hypothetical protein JL722_7485 [Aureococcus anophagefferens]|nr:hypothetical protein JL722_7485 [Aureococcus anophagefferens]
MYPLDTLKTRAQCNDPPHLRLKNVYAGVFGSLVGYVPSAAIIFGFYERAKAFLLLSGFGAARAAFGAAVVGDALGALWLVPHEVLKQRLQTGVHGALGAAVAATWRTGGLLGFYSGLRGQLLRDIPFRCIQMTLYESLRGRGSAGVVGAAVGTATALITTPMDLVKTRHGHRRPPGSVVADARARGVAGFWRGALHRAAYVGPSTAIFFVVYEAAGRLLLEGGAEL